MTGIGAQVTAAVTELLQAANLQRDQILVVGCSTSEVTGATIGTQGSEAVAEAILTALRSVTLPSGIHLAIQCCEHLNRALVIEGATLRLYRELEEVAVRPVAKAGGSLAAQAMSHFEEPVVVESIRAHAGMDIGETLIGMHLRPVAVPVRLAIRQIGEARLTAARTRPKLIGGERACYR
ncbi:TIGR01440 family protein [Heliobacterium gestii]|uniref:UPF0340 protein GTO89_08960 n=1 Tax=Heliomicrobium gestii TaxID=2699 RepID=A0A845LFE7_HELGE|nr:TIGR01440 family protein [Heliomicrobium gestii]MBM7866555.1 uncharacterized protein (TIGR01440 family) [Heliomicrobium gestii]MZP43165.1 TIGR01440 family protein [Heliomicrobium gestii]